MNRYLLSICSILLSVLLYSASPFIKNPERPKNPKAGYTVQLKERFTISPKDDSFFFKEIRNIKAADDGSIFVRSIEQLLQFSSEGKFIKNYFKKGLGPEETRNVHNYFLNKNLLTFHSSSPTKVLIFDITKGKLVKEFLITGIPSGSFGFMFFIGDGYFFWENITQDTKGKIVLQDVKRKAVEFSMDGKKLGDRFAITVPFICLKQGGVNIAISKSNMIEFPIDQSRIAASNTYEYKIKILNVRKYKMETVFNREYRSVPLTEKNKKFLPNAHEYEGYVLNGSKISLPYPDTIPDIQTMLLKGDKLWVVTSTVKDGNKILVDVFDFNGTYLDNFYITCPGNVEPYDAINWLRCFDNKGCLYTTELDENEDPVIKKYTLVGY